MGIAKESYCRGMSRLWTAVFQIDKLIVILVNMTYGHVLDVVGYDPKAFLLETDASHPQFKLLPASGRRKLDKIIWLNGEELLYKIHKHRGCAYLLWLFKELL